MTRFIVGVLAFVIALNLGEALFNVDVSFGEAAVLIGAWILSEVVEGLLFGER